MPSAGALDVSPLPLSFADFLALDASFVALAGLAAKDAGLAKTIMAGDRNRATEHRTELTCGELMAVLSKAKVARGSSGSVDY